MNFIDCGESGEAGGGWSQKVTCKELLVWAIEIGLESTIVAFSTI